jgi:hypothetical protein
MKSKQFNCIQIKYEGSQQIYEQIKSMKLEEELIFWEQATAKMKMAQDLEKEKHSQSLIKTTH